MGRPKKSINNNHKEVGEKLAEFYFKSVGVERGFYNRSTEDFDEEMKGHNHYKATVDFFEGMIESGYNQKELHSLIGQLYKEGIRNTNAWEVISKKEKENIKESDNLIEPDEQYFHSALYNISAPRFAISGDMVIPVSRGEVRRKEVFTLQDLVDYYYENVKTGYTAKRKEAQIGAMRWLLGQATLDEILFSIDSASLTGEDVPVLGLTEYLEDASKEIEYYRSRS